MTPIVGRQPRPWEKRMTVCIAAICHDAGNTRIITCADWLVTSPLGGAETALKTYDLTGDWCCLAAGATGGIIAMVRELSSAMEKVTLDETNIKEVLGRAVRSRKKAISDEITIGKFSMPYDEFRRSRADFPEEQFRRVSETIENTDLSSEMLVVGFYADKTPELCTISSNGNVDLWDTFAVVGAGYDLAMASLFRRGQAIGCDVRRTIYNVYEAKKNAEGNRTVGKQTDLVVFGPNDYMRILRHAVVDNLDKTYSQCNKAPSDTELEFIPEELWK